MWFSHALFSEEGLETAAETLPPARSRLLEHEPAEHATLLSAPRALEGRGGSPGPAGCGGSFRAAEQLTPRLADCRLGRDLADPYLCAMGLVFCISLTQNKNKQTTKKRGWASPQQHGPEDARFRLSLSLSKSNERQGLAPLAEPPLFSLALRVTKSGDEVFVPPNREISSRNLVFWLAVAG